TQETFLQLHRSADRFQAKSDHSTWVFSIAKNVWLQTLRDTGRVKRNAETVSLDALQEAGTLVPSWAESNKDEVLQRILGEERERLLKLAIATLPKQMKSCVFLHFIQGRRQSEIALLLGLSEGTVKFHLSRARAKLREQLAEHFPDTARS